MPEQFIPCQVRIGCNADRIRQGFYAPMQQQAPDNQKNLLVAIVLSMAILFGWQYFYAAPKQEEQRRQTQQQQAAKKGSKPSPAGSGPGVPAAPSGSAGAIPAAPGAGTKAAGGTAAVPGIGAPPVSRKTALSGASRVAISSPSLQGSISLKGARIDDLTLVKYHETVEPGSANLILFSPASAPHPYFAEFGWVAAAGSKIKVPGPDTLWSAQSTAPLTPATPAILTYNNGQGQTFRRIVSIDDDYMFTIRDEVLNRGSSAVSLYPYARIRRTGTPKIQGFFILHEGLVGVLGEESLQEISYSDAVDPDEAKTFNQKGGWLGITDKYWAATLIPAQTAKYQAKMLGGEKTETAREYYQTDYILTDAVTVAPGGNKSVESRLFAGAKNNDIIERYGEKYGIEKFDLMVDWGWFYFITKPLYHLIQWFYKLFGNFGLAILAVTVLVKAAFFPLANKSYVSMSRMKKLQPEMAKIKERFSDDKARQQQAMMELYKKEKINPMSGCLPILLQIPVFFALYKVLFVTIDMRHAPFYGWIQDLSAPDPTSLFNLFGLLPFETPALLPAIGVWPLVMGVTMWVQMQLNPQQPDPIQQKIFNWMPVMFTFLLASFPAGLVLYWAWNNLLSIIQQAVIMKKQGVEIPLLQNIGLEKFLGAKPAKPAVLHSQPKPKPKAKAVTADADEDAGSNSAAAHSDGAAARSSDGTAEDAAPEAIVVSAEDGTDRARGAGPMSRQKALQMLGLKKGASKKQIKAAHQRQMKGEHSGANGSDPAIAAQINRARDVLLGRRGRGNGAAKR